MKYNIRLFVNNKLSLAHVAVNNNSDANNRNSTLKARYSKAKWGFSKGNELDESSTIHLSGFHYKMMNSEIDDWNEIIVSKDVSADTAKRIKLTLIKRLKEEGFIISNRITIYGSKGGTGNHINSALTIDPKNTNLKKFKKICKRAVEGLTINENDFSSKFNQLYKKLISGETITRYDVWTEFSAIN